jgi:hypothetical protein
LDDLKRRVRKLKRIEVKIRFQGEMKPNVILAWDSLFDLHDVPYGKAKYSLSALSAMNREEYKHVVDEFFALVYYKYYRENGIAFLKAYDPGTLSLLDLPFDADEQDVKRRFRELAKEYHPDMGGDASKFIELMKVYEKLIGK